MKMNVWKSVYTGEVYEMPMDWMPKFEGWELIGTVEKQKRGDRFTSSLLLSTAAAHQKNIRSTTAGGAHFSAVKW